MSNVLHMTLTNESIRFTPNGVYIQPVNGDSFRFHGRVMDLILIMIYHHDLDIENVVFKVTDWKRECCTW